MKSKTTHRRRGAFSLVELLIVITIIGTIASIAVPAMSGIYSKSDAAKVKRNAQEIASTFASAKAAGNAASFADKAAAIAAVTEAPGLQGRGTFASSSFVSPMSGGEAQAAEIFLRYDAAAGMLEYLPDGVPLSQYSSFAQWDAARNAAMNQFFQQNPAASEQLISEFYQGWMAANPPPSNGPPSQAGVL